MTDAQKIHELRIAVCGLLGQCEEYWDALEPCNHAKGSCRCRLKERMREARKILKQTDPKTTKTKPTQQAKA
jgi:hypothetical protein